MFEIDAVMIKFLVFCALVLAMLVGGIVLCIVGKKRASKAKKWLGAILVVISSLLIAGYLVFLALIDSAFDRYYEDDLVVTSPDGEYELIIREWQAMGGSGAYVYIKDGFFKKKVDYLGFDDYSMPFKGGMYEIEWQDDCVIIKYHGGGEGDNPWRSTEIELK